MAKTEQPEMIIEKENCYCIEQLRKKHKTKLSVYLGTADYRGWKHGKEVTEQEYLEAVEAFKKMPASGQKRGG